MKLKLMNGGHMVAPHTSHSVLSKLFLLFDFVTSVPDHCSSTQYM